MNWIDGPGGNSMCYWSENHQILFASAEYLIGQQYPERIFQNSGLTDGQHMAKARQRILDWLDARLFNVYGPGLSGWRLCGLTTHFCMNIRNDFAVFHSHPAVENMNSSSPNYWDGYSHFPHSAQHKNINLFIYKLPEEKGVMEKDLLDNTHAHFLHGKFVGLRVGEWKLKIDDKRPELYNLHLDVSEKHNVAGDHPKIVKRLRKKMEDISRNMKMQGHERTIELAFEKDHRWNDVRRWEILPQTGSKDYEKMYIQQSSNGDLSYPIKTAVKRCIDE